MRTGAKGTRKVCVYGEFTLGADDGRNAYALAKHAARSAAGLSIGYGVTKTAPR
jgi:hypothetical protein